MRHLLVLLAIAAAAAAAPALAKPPVWDKRVDSPKRFKVLKAFDSEAVLDSETGVVWERAPAHNPTGFNGAFVTCADAVTGGRAGWRPPTVYELRALVGEGSEALPEGHPFTVPDAVYWSSTTTPGFPTQAFVGDLGEPSSKTNISNKDTNRSVWCVRGGIGPGGE